MCHLTVRIEACQFDPSVRSAKLPVTLDLPQVAILFPCLNLRANRGEVGDVLVEALTGQPLNSVSAKWSQLPCLGRW